MFAKCTSYSRITTPLLQELYELVAFNYSMKPINNIHKKLFDPAFASSKSYTDKANFLSEYYGYSCATQVDTELEYEELCAAISDDDGSAVSYVEDLEQYIEKGPLEDYPVVTDMSCPFFVSVLSDFDMAASLGKSNSTQALSAHLRFAHAETLIPVLSALGLVTENPFVYATSDTAGEYAQREFNLHYQSPMAANIMFVVYDCDEDVGSVRDAGEGIYVQLLQNEQAMPFPGCMDVIGAESPLCSLVAARTIVSQMACKPAEFSLLCGELNCPDE